MASDVTIVNRALTLLGESRKITAFSDASIPGRLATRDFADERDDLLYHHPWNFALVQFSLPANATAPTHTYARAFDLPAVPWCLRVLSVVSNGHEPWKVQRRQIVTDIVAPLAGTMIVRIADAELMTPGFREALAAKLAWGWAETLTGSSAIADKKGKEFGAKLSAARSADGQEGTTEPFHTSTWLDARS